MMDIYIPQYGVTCRHRIYILWAVLISVKSSRRMNNGKVMRNHRNY